MLWQWTMCWVAFVFLSQRFKLLSGLPLLRIPIKTIYTGDVFVLLMNLLADADIDTKTHALSPPTPLLPAIGDIVRTCKDTSEIATKLP